MCCTAYPVPLGILTRWLITLALLVVAGCGGRSLGMPPDDVQTTVVDPATAACWPPSDQVTIYTNEDPSYVHSLDRTNSGQYVLGSSHRLSDRIARLSILDGDSLAQLGTIEVDAVSVHARFDQWSGEVVAQAETYSDVWYQRYLIAAGRNLSLIEERHLCDNCVAALGGPETVETFSGAAVRDLADDRLRVYVMPGDEPGEMYSTVAIDGSSPQLAASGTELMLLYLHEGHLWTRRIGDHAEAASPIRRSNAPVMTLLGAGSYSDGIVVTAVLTADSSNRQIEVIKLSGDSEVNRFSVPAPQSFANVGAVSFSPITVGVAWGQDSGDPGAYFLGGLTQGFAPIFGPTKVSAPFTPPTSAYTHWAATAYHPTGHAVVWGGWHQDEHYGIYGKIIPCGFVP